jgi:hypothetical protein
MTSFLSRLDGGIVVQVTDGLQNQTDLNWDLNAHMCIKYYSTESILQTQD